MSFVELLTSLVIILVTTNFAISLEACELDDDCTTREGSSGIVAKADNCGYFTKLSKKEQRRAIPCGFVGRSSLVCCPEDSSDFSTRFTRKSIGECKNFGKREKPDDPFGFRVTNGKQSDVGEFPHFAAIGYRKDDEISFDCGGALISSNFVLTAAHCCKQSRTPELVRLGRTSASLDDEDDDSEHQDVDVEEVIRYPDYIKTQKYHDIALLKLSRAVKFSHNIWPACLYPENDFASKTLTIAGFGRNDIKDASKKADWLLKASVQEVPLDECREELEIAYNGKNLPALSNGITDNIICARDKLSRADTCQGDSGSALKFKANETFYIVGVTSFGVSCYTTLPSFYTRVYSYLDWIEDIVWR